MSEIIRCFKRDNGNEEAAQGVDEAKKKVRFFNKSGDASNKANVA